MRTRHCLKTEVKIIWFTLRISNVNNWYYSVSIIMSTWYFNINRFSTRQSGSWPCLSLIYDILPLRLAEPFNLMIVKLFCWCLIPKPNNAHLVVFFVLEWTNRVSEKFVSALLNLKHNPRKALVPWQFSLIIYINYLVYSFPLSWILVSNIIGYIAHSKVTFCLCCDTNTHV